LHRNARILRAVRGHPGPHFNFTTHIRQLSTENPLDESMAAVQCSRFTSVSAISFYNDFDSSRKHFLGSGAKCE
jgi:hypothetical protein